MRARLVFALPYVAVAWYATRALAQTGVPWLEILTYAAYWLFALVMPGFIIFRALVKTSGSLCADLLLGAATGVCVELGAWAAASIAGIRPALAFWPLLVVALLLVPRIRSRVSSRPTASRRPVPLSSGRSWTMHLTFAGAALLTIWHIKRTYFVPSPLPPTGVPLYQDLLWHMSLVHEAQRSFPLMTPQVADGGTLIYHWFSDAHLAAAGLITGIDVPTLVLRLWIIPIALLGVALVAVVARTLTRSWWAPPMASLLMASTVTIPLWPSVVTGLNHLDPLSPSQQYSHVTLVFVLFCLVRVLRAKTVTRGDAALLFIAAVATMGAKSSALPMVAAGLIAALVFARSATGSRRLAILTGGAAVLSLAGSRFVAGGSFDSGLQLFSSLSLFRPYRTLVTPTPNLKTRILPGLLNEPHLGRWFLIVLLLVAAIACVKVLLALTTLTNRDLRRDPFAWVLAGMCVAALGAFMVISHRGYSQFYFVHGAIPAACLLIVWSLDTRVRATPGAPSWARGSLLVGAGATAGLTWWAMSRPGVPAAQLPDHLRSMLITVGVVVVLASVIALIARRSSRHSGARLVVPALAVGALLVTGPVNMVHAQLHAPSPAKASSNPANLARSQSGLWMDAHLPQDALIATNVHCRGAQTSPTCDARQYWITGLGGRRAWIEAWRYVPEHALGFTDQAALDANDAAFTQPTKERIDELRSHGVSWLVVDDTVRPAPDTRALTGLATLRYQNGPISIFQLM